MKAFENNAFFWQKLDTLYLAGKLVVDQPKNCVQKINRLSFENKKRTLFLLKSGALCNIMAI